MKVLIGAEVFFVLLKITGYLVAPWWLVLLPLWGPMLYFFGVLFYMLGWAIWKMRNV